MIKSFFRLVTETIIVFTIMIYFNIVQFHDVHYFFTHDRVHRTHWNSRCRTLGRSKRWTLLHGKKLSLFERTDVAKKLNQIFQYLTQTIQSKKYFNK